MKIKNLHVSTVAEDARDTALKYGLGLEIAEFCTAMNMDGAFPEWDAKVRAEIDGIKSVTFHAPFNELCPAAIDPLVLNVAKLRYRQTFKLAPSYGAKRIVVHSGYVPLIYFKEYFHERSVAFWRELLRELPEDFTLLLENVMEDSPELLSGIVREIADPRFRLCFDIGHANTIVSDTPMDKWIDVTAPYIAHVHIHNNYRQWDDHNPPGDGLIDMRYVLDRLTSLLPDSATYAIESIKSAPAAEWLVENGFI
ncbi:MAG: sugar phosphate isomerase/epimerase [Oscillospiraceae bacterium]|jgi:sugar phosphate isomerase/epimerase|nr:sugar phosphate isomerase/epimerase [Oscillospiraceae bacterium]